MVQFISFSVSTVENYFDRILTTFPGPGTTARARKTRFCTWNIHTHFGVQFLSFLVSTVEKCFGRVLTTFQVQAPPEQEKFKTRPRWLGLPAETYLHFFGVQFLSFPMSTAKQYFSTTRACPEKAKLITGPGWPSVAPETYRHCLGCSSYHLSSVLLKTVLVEFWQLFRAQAPLEQVKWKFGPGWPNFKPETYPHSLWCSSYRF